MKQLNLGVENATESCKCVWCHREIRYKEPRMYIEEINGKNIFHKFACLQCAERKINTLQKKIGKYSLLSMQVNTVPGLTEKEEEEPDTTDITRNSDDDYMEYVNQEVKELK